jgi:phosphomannomutase
MAIRFGTSGSRAVIADDFTFAGVRKVTEAICTHLKTSARPGKSGDGAPALPEITKHGDYLAKSRNWTGGVARSVVTSHLVDRVAEAQGLPVYEMPVGFKFIGELINEDKIILGGEESAGLSIKGHYPEEDGILACLLAAETVAARGQSLTQQRSKPGPASDVWRPDEWMV